MPKRDRTGPLSEGPMTGRRMGYCGGSKHIGDTGFKSYDPEIQRNGFTENIRKGRRHGFGFRPEFRNWYGRKIAPRSEIVIIETELEILKEQVAHLQQRFSESGQK